MKKYILYSLIGMCLAVAVVPTGCIDETFPTNAVTADQLGASSKATEALLWAMPAFVNKINSLGRADDELQHYDFGYGAIMHIRDVMTEDMAIHGSAYSVWFDRWMRNVQQGENYISAQFLWNFYTQFVQTSNNLIAAVDPETTSATQAGYLGTAYAFRAMQYLDMARMYEFLENDVTTAVSDAGKDILHLTVPIITETMTEAEARNNPRVSREEMFDFILADLNKAEQYLDGFTPPTKTLPSLAVAYGLKARLYMWVEDYPNAREYARKAIDAGGHKPLTEAEWHNTTSGFNTLATSSWMWGTQMTSEEDAVQTYIVNWTSWMSNETTFGYAFAGPMSKINRRTYERINDADFRKRSWKAPAGHPLEGRSPYLDAEHGAAMPEYASTKFRPAGGNMAEPTVGAASAFPLMRVEEMYLIEAEAAAHGNAAEGKTLIEKFMKDFRYSAYTCNASDTQGVVDEIFLQKRVELWGEGLIFFDYKRLNKSVTRGYPGTNFTDADRYNTTTRPAWMNFCIIRTEKMNNAALVGYENPDPSDKYTIWTE